MVEVEPPSISAGFIYLVVDLSFIYGGRFIKDKFFK